MEPIRIVHNRVLVIYNRTIIPVREIKNIQVQTYKDDTGAPYKVDIKFYVSKSSPSYPIETVSVSYDGYLTLLDSLLDALAEK